MIETTFIHKGQKKRQMDDRMDKKWERNHGGKIIQTHKHATRQWEITIRDEMKK